MTPTMNVAALPATNSGNTLQGASFPEDAQAGDGSMPSISFSTLFKQLMEKSAPQGATTAQLINIGVEEIENVESDSAESALNALLPFLDAIGLTQDINAEKLSLAEMASPETYQQSDALIPFAGPITPQVMNAANIAEERSIVLPAVAGTDESPVSASLSAAPQVATTQVAVAQLANPQVAVAQVNAQSSAVEVEIDRIEKPPMQSDQLVHEAAAPPPSDNFSDELDNAIGGQPLPTKAETSADGNKQGNQPNPVSANPLGFSPTGNQGTQAGEQSAKLMMNVTQPVGAAGWDHELSQRIVWMANRSEGRAELVLTPPQMGRVEVSLTVSGDQATASFASANPVVREALESALPRLREVLAEAGIQLGQAQVGAENARQSAQHEKNPDNFGTHQETSAEKSSIMATLDHDSAISTLKPGRGLVDVFA